MNLVLSTAMMNHNKTMMMVMMMMMMMVMMMMMMMMMINYLCGMFDQRNALSLISSRDHYQRFLRLKKQLLYYFNKNISSFYQLAGKNTGQYPKGFSTFYWGMAWTSWPRLYCRDSFNGLVTFGCISHCLIIGNASK